MTVSELIEELIRFPQDSNENLEVWVDDGFGVYRMRTIKRQSVFDSDVGSQKTVAMITSKPWSVEPL